MRSQRILLVAFFLTLSVAFLWRGESASAQGPATPIPVIPPTFTPTNPPPTEPPTRTPTSLGPASAEALNPGTNVRTEPNIEADLVQQINPGERFPILGRYFEWYQLQFPAARSGVAWVHNSVVQVLGDPALIPDFSNTELPTQDPAILNAQATADVIILTPGGELTVTAQVLASTPQAVDSNNSDPNAPQVPAQALPTFTFPAVTATPINLADLGTARNVTVGSGGLPPIAPIAALFGIGGLGLLITLLRRL
jgi:hypothetical protein